MRDSGLISNCLFCNCALSDKTRKQHIIQESIGGTLSTQSTTCDACNEYFAESIDRVVAKKFSQCMNALAFALKADAPTLQVRMKGSNDQLRMEPGNVPHARAAVTFRPDGGVSIRAKDESQARKLLKTTGKKPDAIKKVIYDTEATSGMIVHESIVLHEDELRSAKKIALEYLAHRAPYLLRHLAVEDEIKYIRHGAVDAQRRPTVLPNVPNKGLLAAGFRPEPFCHSIWLECESNAIECLVVLFGAVAYRFRIDAYKGPAHSLIYQKNILKTSGPDIVGVATQGAKLPNPIPLPPDMLQRESIRLRRLYIDACWHVDVKCKEETVNFYWMHLRTGKSPGDTIDATGARLAEIMQTRIAKVFTGALISTEAAAESNKIFRQTDKSGVFKNESVDSPSARVKDVIWAMHLELMDLHRKYVGLPDYGYENYEITPFPGQAQ